MRILIATVLYSVRSNLIVNNILYSESPNNSRRSREIQPQRLRQPRKLRPRRCPRIRLRIVPRARRNQKNNEKIKDV